MNQIFANLNILQIVIILVFLSILFWGFSLVYKYSRKKKLSDFDKKEFKKYFLNIKNNKTSDKEKIIFYDKLYHKILQKYGYNGTFGEILKQKPNEIGDLNKIWELHKIRNKVVHELDFEVENFPKKLKDYEKEIVKILA